jgi:hypothetical protein
MAGLRKRMDGDEGFMSAHQIKKTRVHIGQKSTPSWATNDAEVRKILLGSFPKLVNNTKQRSAAARWSQAIVLVYRLGFSYSHAAAEMGITYLALESMLRNIRRAAKGLRSDTNKPRNGKPGRPKSNKCQSSQT